jgi:hypothetical protein
VWEILDGSSDWQGQHEETNEVISVQNVAAIEESRNIIRIKVHIGRVNPIPQFVEFAMSNSERYEN